MKPKRIVAAIDISATAEAIAEAAGVLAAAAELASPFGAEVIAIHVIGPGDGDDDEGAAETSARLVLANRVGAFSNDFAHLVVRSHVTRAATNWLAILSAAERLDVDLVVLGGGRYVRDGVLGSTATMVTNMSRRSVLVVRRAQRPAPRTVALSARRLR